MQPELRPVSSLSQAMVTGSSVTAPPLKPIALATSPSPMLDAVTPEERLRLSDRDGAVAEKVGPPDQAATLPWVSGVTLEVAGCQFRLTQRSVLGRNGDVATQIFRSHRQISRRHCELVLDEEVWSLTHLSENSPSRLNGEDVAYRQSRPLLAGMNELVLGEAVVLLLHVDPSPMEGASGRARSSGLIDRYRQNGKLQAVLARKPLDEGEVG